MSLPNRVPPRFEEGEKAILGGLLLDPDVVDRVITEVAPDDFAAEPHRVIYRAIKYLADNSQPIDWVSLTEVLRKYGRLEAAGGISALRITRG